jgi:hypothetical protein
MKSTIQSPYKFLAVILIGLFAFACSDQSDVPDGSNISTSKIVGTWYTDSSRINLSINDTNLVDYLVERLQLTNNEAQLEFDSIVSEIKPNMVGQVSFNKDYTYNTLFNSEGGSGLWEINSDETRVTLDPGTQDESELRILSLDEYTVTIQFDEFDPVDLDDDGFSDEELKIEVTLLFKK